MNMTRSAVPHYRVVLQFSGGAVSSGSGSNLADLISENTDTLPMDVTGVCMGEGYCSCMVASDLWPNVLFLTQKNSAATMY